MTTNESDRAFASTSHSIDSSVTHVQPSNEKQVPNSQELQRVFSNGHGESALPENKVEEEFENLESDWENDPENARNWSTKKKWTTVCIVRSEFLTFL